MSDTISPIVQAARDFTIKLNNPDIKLQVPEGDVRDFMSERLKGKFTGARPLTLALAEFIDSNNGLADKGSQMYLERLSGNKDAKPPVPALVDIINDIASDPPAEELRQKIALLQSAIVISGNNLFDHVSTAARTIARENNVTINKLNDQGDGYPEKKSGKDKNTPPKDDTKGTAYEATQDGLNPNLDKTIRDSAKEHDKSHGAVDNKAIGDSARNSEMPEFKIPESDRTEFEKLEQLGGYQHQSDLFRKAHEIKQYVRIAETLERVFNATLGSALNKVPKQSARTL